MCGTFCDFTRESGDNILNIINVARYENTQVFL